jgi:ABC-type multidrug transport system ATPase subunit
MTVTENLEFYGRFKGMERIEVYIDEALEKFNLVAKKNTLAANLSGGQKRKL